MNFCYISYSSFYKFLLICINILNFKYLKTRKFHSAYRLKEIYSNEELTDVAEIHFIEIPKLEEGTDEKDMLVNWVEFLKDPDKFIFCLSDFLYIIGRNFIQNN